MVPTLGTRMVWRTSAWPMTFSRNLGASMPFIAASISSMHS